MHGNLVSNVYFVASFNDSKAEKVPKKSGFALNKNKMKKKKSKKAKKWNEPFVYWHPLTFSALRVFILTTVFRSYKSSAIESM